MVAVGAGYGLPKIVCNWKWDVKYPWLFRYKNDRPYAVMGRDVPGSPGISDARIYVRVEALTSIPMNEEEAKSRLYRGIVEGFTTEDNGSLYGFLSSQFLRPVQSPPSWRYTFPRSTSFRIC
jgi:hypothetical protein